MCKGISLPASNIDQATVTYMGRALQIPGNRAAQQITTSVYNDEGMEIRNYIESWMEGINSHVGNKRTLGSRLMSYTGEMEVSQLKKDGSGSSKKYFFHNCWPSSSPEIALSWDTSDIQTFDIVWDYSHWTSPQSGIAGAPASGGGPGGPPR